MNRVNYQKEMEKILDAERRAGHVPLLLLHSCCAPCSSYVLEYLSKHFRILDFYYNPNISPKEEYDRRADELERLIGSMPLEYPVSFIRGEYEPERFREIARGLEDAPEGGERCTRCFELRLRESAEQALRYGCEYFTTTLSISPLKDAGRLNAIGQSLAGEYGVKYLVSDFKKKDGYKRSVGLSAEYGLYRQNYCGCAYSKRASTGPFADLQDLQNRRA